MRTDRQTGRQTDRQTGGHDEAKRCFTQFCESAQKDVANSVTNFKEYSFRNLVFVEKIIVLRYVTTCLTN
jgi:hypothetical protein